MDGLLPALLAAEALEDKRIVGGVRRMADDIGIEAFARQMHACSRRGDQRRTLASLSPSVPVLAVAGGRDKLIPPRCAREIQELLTERAALGNVAPWAVKSNPLGGHLLMLEQPASVHETLRSWADEVRRSHFQLH